MTRSELETPMHRTIVIGLGGTGLEIIRHLRRRIVENHEAGLAAFPNLGFMFVDTDGQEIERMRGESRKAWEVLGKSVALRPNEYKIIGVEDLDVILNNIDAYADLRDWFPKDQLKRISITAKGNPGASQIRPLGRLVFNFNTDPLRNWFLERFSALPQAEGGGTTRIIVACSISGGTGSGMFLDLAYQVRQWTNGGAETFGFLVLPDPKANRGDRYLPNAYASLLELNYFSAGVAKHKGRETPVSFPLLHGGDVVKQPPFDNCYLVSPTNAVDIGRSDGVELSLTAVADMIAHRIYLNFDRGFAAGAASAAQSLLSNGRQERTERLEDPFNGSIHSQNFFTFGLSSIEYPTEQITEMLALRLTDRLFTSWVQSRELPANTGDLANTYLPEIKASDEYLIAEQDIFGSATYQRIPQEVSILLNARMANLPAQHKAVEARRIWNEILSVFRQVGHTAYYRARVDDLKGAVQIISREAINKLCGFVTDPALGHEFALQIVAKFREIFADKHAHFTKEFQRINTQEKTSRGSVESFLGDLTEAEGKILFRDSSTQTALTNLNVALSQNLTLQVQKEAYAYGVLLVAALQDEFKRIEEEFRKWALSLESLRLKLKEEIRRISGFLETQNTSTKDFNGAILFRPDLFEQLYAQFDLNDAVRYLREQLLLKKDVLGVLVGDATQNQNQIIDETLERTRALAIEWLTQKSLVKVTQRNIADQLFKDYPNTADLERLLKVNYNKSAPFLVFSQAEVLRHQGVSGAGYRQMTNTNAKLVALMDDENHKFESVYQVRQLISHATPCGPDGLKRVEDQHRIIFLQETTAFPLRIVRDMKVLRQRYRAYRDVPLHIVKDFNPALPDLLYVEQDEIEKIQLAEEDFLLGWNFGVIRPEEDRVQNQSNICYVYQDYGSKIPVTLGPDWEAAFRFWMSGIDTVVRHWNRLREDNQQRIDGLVSKTDKADLSRALLVLVADQAARFRFGDQDPAYREYDTIRRRIVQRYALPVDFPAPAPSVQTAGPAAAPAGPKPDAEARFRARAQAFLEQGKGKLNPAKETILNNLRRDLGLSESAALALVQELQAKLTPVETAAMTEFRQLVEAYLSDGALTDSAREDLEAERDRLGLSPDQAHQIIASAGA